MTGAHRRGTLSRVTLEQIATELYRLPPEEFTTRRNARAKELKPDDRALSDAVAALPKPAVSAWALDVFAHERGEQLDALLEAADELRKAQESGDGDEVRALTARAHSLVRAALDSVQDVATSAGHPLSDQQTGQVEQTLRAAMADPDAAAVVRAGLLAKPLAPAGFGPVDLTGAAAVVPEGQAAPKKKRAKADDAPARRAAAQALEEAQREAQRTAQELARATEQHDAARREVEERERQLAQAREQAVRTEAQAASARKAHDTAVQALDRAAREAERAGKT